MMQDVRLAGERAGDEDPALLPAREGADLGGGAVGEADDVERAGDDLPVGGAQPTEPADAGEPPGRDDLLGGGPDRRREGVPLGHVAEAGAVVELAAGTPKRVTVPATRSLRPSDALHQGRLARPVGPDDRHDLAAADRQVDVGEDGAVAVAERRAAQGRRRVVRRRRRSSGSSGAELMSSPDRRAARRGCCA